MKQKSSEESKRERLENALLDFVERVTKDTAPPAQLEALPKVAATLLTSLLNC